MTKVFQILLKRLLGATTVLAVAFLSAILLQAHGVFADSFNAGRIMDDSVFTNSSTMNASQIQTFLNSKVSSCDTNGTQTASDFGSTLTHAQYAASKGWPGPPYTCLKDYTENNLTSAQIIYNTAQKYQINPQVLIVLLQKEQGLVTDTWPLSSQYKTASGYGCPDTAPCDSQYYGLTNQLDWSGKMFRAIMNASPTWYTPYILGNNYIQYNPDTSCGGSTVNIQNRTTQALYNYTPYQPNAAALAAPMGASVTCGAYGNLNFFRYFSSWFGSPTAYQPPSCDSRVSGVVCVWSLYEPSQDPEFLTVDNQERDSAAISDGYSYDRNAFYAFTSQQPNTVPIYRIKLSTGQHFYTASASEAQSLTQGTQNILEGVGFYAYPSTTSTNVSYPVYRVNGPAGHIWTTSTTERDSYLSNGYTDEGVAFNVPSASAPTPMPAAGRVNVYRLANGINHMYTANLSERDQLINSGVWTYEGFILQAPATATSTPVYRLFHGADHLFTSSDAEKTALTQAGWTYEGVAWYIDNQTPQTYRLYTGGSHFFTTDLNEALNISNRSGTYEGVAFGNSQSPNIPVYRLYNGQYHFFTASTDELMAIVNKGWSYEGVAWYANGADTNTPVYRLNGPYHFYTSSSIERDNLVRSGWSYEGVAWYANGSSTSTPIYRLNGASSHFYTSSSQERDNLVRSGWSYEGVAWYGE